MTYKSARSRATDIPQKVKEAVWERDGRRCVFCGRTDALPSCHCVSRAQGGRGVEQNIITACQQCHHRMDNTVHRKDMVRMAKKYLQTFYPDWKEEDYIYDKWAWVKSNS